MITSPHNDRVKLAFALQTQAKARRKAGRIALEGVRLIRDAVERGGHTPEFILYDPQSVDETLVRALSRFTLLPAAPEIMRHLSDTEQPQGILGVFPTPAPSLPDPLTRLLILDAIRDPGNLGALLRTAAAAGVCAVILAPGCVDPYNPKVLRGGMGAHFRVPVVERSWAEIEALCGGRSVYLAASDGDLRYDAANWSAAWALIIGSEAHGASAEAENIATQRIAIPMETSAESLNAAVAAGILLFEARRKSS